jgi:hypothetical protein
MGADLSALSLVTAQQDVIRQLMPIDPQGRAVHIAAVMKANDERFHQWIQTMPVKNQMDIRITSQVVNLGNTRHVFNKAPLEFNEEMCKKFFTDSTTLSKTLQTVDKEIAAARAAIIQERSVMIKTRQEQFKQCDPNDHRILRHLHLQTLIKQQHSKGEIDYKVRKQKEEELFHDFCPVLDTILKENQDKADRLNELELLGKAIIRDSEAYETARQAIIAKQQPAPPNSPSPPQSQGVAMDVIEKPLPQKSASQLLAEETKKDAERLEAAQQAEVDRIKADLLKIAQTQDSEDNFEPSPPRDNDFHDQPRDFQRMHVLQLMDDLSNEAQDFVAAKFDNTYVASFQDLATQARGMLQAIPRGELLQPRL